MTGVPSVVLPALVGKSRDDIGGVAAFLVTLESRLRERGSQVEMLGYGPASDREPGFHPILDRELPRGRDLTYALWKHRNRWSFPPGTVVHLQRPDQALGFMKGPWPMVITFHGWHHRTIRLRQGRLAGLAYGLLQRRVAERADAVTFVTRRDRENFLRMYPQYEAKAHFTPIGVDRDRFRPGNQGAARRDMGLPTRCRSLAFVGRLEPEKNVEALVRAVERIPDLELWIAGKGSQEARLKDIACPRVRFLGHLVNDDVPRLLVAADALALASHHEGLATVVLEAWASGRPVVVPPVGDFPELMRDSGGILARDNSIEALVEAIGRLLGTMLQPGAVTRLEVELRDKSADYDWDRVTDGFLDLYSRVQRKRMERVRSE